MKAGMLNMFSVRLVGNLEPGAETIVVSGSSIDSYSVLQAPFYLTADIPGSPVLSCARMQDWTDGLATIGLTAAWTGQTIPDGTDLHMRVCAELLYRLSNVSPASGSIDVSYHIPTSGPEGAIDYVAVGEGCWAESDSVAIGKGAYASAKGIAIGKNSYADGESIGIGDADANGSGTVAIGKGCQTVQNGSIAIGNGATGYGEGSVGIGKNANASSQRCISVGLDAYSYDDSVAIGNGANSSGSRGVSIGVAANAYGHDGIAIGRSAVTYNYSIAIGCLSEAQGEYGISIGSGNPNNWAHAIAIGDGASPGTYCVADVRALFALPNISTDPAPRSSNDYVIRHRTAPQIVLVTKPLSLVSPAGSEFIQLPPGLRFFVTSIEAIKISQYPWTGVPKISVGTSSTDKTSILPPSDFDVTQQYQRVVFAPIGSVGVESIYVDVPTVCSGSGQAKVVLRGFLLAV